MSVLTALAGVISLLFIAVPSAKINTTANSTDHNNDTFTNETTQSTPEVDPEMLVVTFWSYLVVRTAFG